MKVCFVFSENLFDILIFHDIVVFLHTKTWRPPFWLRAKAIKVYKFSSVWLLAINWFRKKNSARKKICAIPYSLKNIAILWKNILHAFEGEKNFIQKKNRPPPLKSQMVDPYKVLFSKEINGYTNKIGFFLSARYKLDFFSKFLKWIASAKFYFGYM